MPNMEQPEEALAPKPARLTRSSQNGCRLSSSSTAEPSVPPAAQLTSHTYLDSASDSDLTDLEGDEHSHDALALGDSGVFADSYSDDSDYGQRVSTKAKPNRTKRAKATKKGKGRSKNDGAAGAYNDGETESKKRKGKKDLVAEEAVWQDIPDWGDRKDCPLESLPPEVLDRCFGQTTGLSLRDYVALAGVCKLFRTQFDDNFFRAIIGRRSWPSSTNNEAFKYADTPFTNTVKEWRKDRIPLKPARSHYVPRGERKDWTEAQYIVYREEKAFWRAAEKERRRKLCLENEKRAERDRLDARRGRYVVVRQSNRKVLADVKGRCDGEPPIAKDERGLPAVDIPPAPVKISATEETESPKVADGATSATAKRLSDASNAALEPRKKSRLTPGNRLEEWVVPETDTESELEEPIHYDYAGVYVPFDHWKSDARKKAVDTINHDHINKTDALREFKVTEAELITLKHLLVTNPMSSKQPQQAFLRAAVEALALRAHGGPLGHIDHVRVAEERTTKARQQRLEKYKDLAKPNAPHFYAGRDGWTHLATPLTSSNGGHYDD